MSAKQKKEHKASMRLARTLFLIFVVFATCWTPYAIIVAVDYKDEFTQELHIFSVLLAHTNSSLNCILYGLTNRYFRQSYKKLLCLDRVNLPCSTNMRQRHSVDVEACNHVSQISMAVGNESRNNTQSEVLPNGQDQLEDNMLVILQAHSVVEGPM